MIREDVQWAVCTCRRGGNCGRVLHPSKLGAATRSGSLPDPRVLRGEGQLASWLMHTGLSLIDPSPSAEALLCHRPQPEHQLASHKGLCYAHLHTGRFLLLPLRHALLHRCALVGQIKCSPFGPAVLRGVPSSQAACQHRY